MDKALKTLLALAVSILAVPFCHAQIMQQVAMATPQSSTPTAPTIVQSQSTGSSGGPLFFVTNNPITAGNIEVVVMLAGGASSTLSFSDSLGNVPTSLGTTALTTDDDAVAILCAPITHAGGSPTIQFLINGSNGSAYGIYYEIHNSTGTCATDVTFVQHSSTAQTACSSGAFTTTTANDMLIGVCGMDGTSTSAVPAGTGWTGLNAGNTGHPLLLGEYQVAVTPGSYTATSGTIPSQEQATVQVALKP